MKTATLTISDISRLEAIQHRLVDNKPISKLDKEYLADFLAQLPAVNQLLLEKAPFDETISVGLLATGHIEMELEKWRNLFESLPGWDYAAHCYFVDQEDKGMLGRNVIAIAQFAPSISYNLDTTKEGYEVWLKDDGTAEFYLCTLEDAKSWPELYNFKGSWKEAYLLLIETLKKGWPMEEFPEELLPLLKK
ncbi:hypothetical protein HQ865_22765 [Mucilaginibacter mali]|uniref:Uncharacterized protein n=1 Tax=Mucilaginibacter mali TaxID=2740462 RepID=A0A7D4QCQ3_9SPHI|nr:hypothetical protein [Mucilaginibacter mali]QKJ32465.1 hypothetical protein HQ865_22765 [Mucilaginibacter mali]